MFVSYGEPWISGLKMKSGLVTPWIHDVRLSRFGLLKAVNGGHNIQCEQVMAICATYHARCS